MERVAYSVDPFRFSIVLLKKTDLFGENDESVDPFRFSIVLLKKTDLFGENALWIH